MHELASHPCVSRLESQPSPSPAPANEAVSRFPASMPERYRFLVDSSWQVRRPAAAESVRSEASPDGAAKPSGATLGAFPTRSGGDVAGVRRFAALRLQAKLSVGGTDDPAEREADAVAAEVTSRIRQGIALESQEVRRTPAQRIQRRSTDGGAGGRVDADTEQRIRARRGSGAPLPDDVARQMESGFGSDFSHVRLHTGAEPAELNRRLQARAFTVGSDVFMGEGSDLRSPAGQELLAHELTHVVQQGDTTVRRDEIKRTTLPLGRMRSPKPSSRSSMPKTSRAKSSSLRCS